MTGKDLPKSGVGEEGLSRSSARQRIHLRGFEPLTFGSVDNKPLSVSSNATNDLRNSSKTQTAPQKHVIGEPLQPMAATDSFSEFAAQSKCQVCSVISPKLTRLIRAWDQLSPHVQETILLLIESVTHEHNESLACDR